MSVYPIVLSQKNFIAKDHLRFPFEERGLQFGDGVYEVIRIYNGTYYLLTEHLERLFRSVQAIKINFPYSIPELKSLLNELLQQNKMKSDGKLYLQVTRGSASRDHIFPNHTEPNVYGYLQDLPRNLTFLNQGVHTITQQDSRWDNCYIKSLNLLPNVLAKQAAFEKRCYEAILHKNGYITECSSANVYLVKDQAIYTHPPTKQILYGCVRMRVKQFADDLNIPFVEEPFYLEEIFLADELFLTSSTSEIMPIISVDEKRINNGKPGEVTKLLQQAYARDAKLA